MGICSKLFKCGGFCSLIIVILAVFLQIWIKYGDQREFNRNTTAEEAATNIDLTGKTIIVTGANTGIGKPTARVLLSHGAKVILACRNPTKANNAKTDIINKLSINNFKNLTKHQLTANIDAITLDLSSLKSIKQFADNFLSKYSTLNYLILNAGAAFFDYAETVDGVEQTFGVNHLGGFYLTQLLTPILIKTATSDAIGRVIAVSSAAHTWAAQPIDPWMENLDLINDETKFSSMGAYAISKACNILFAKEYNTRYGGDNVFAVSVHPGEIKTELGRRAKGIMKPIFETMGVLVGIFGKSLDQGAATTIRTVAVSDRYFKQNGGSYWFDCNVEKERLRDDMNEQRPRELLWSLSEKLVKERI